MVHRAEPTTFKAELEFYARSLDNSRQYINHVHGLRQSNLEGNPAASPEPIDVDGQSLQTAPADLRVEPSFQLFGRRIASECSSRCMSAHSRPTNCLRSAADRSVKSSHSEAGQPDGDSPPAGFSSGLPGRPIPEDFKIPDPADEKKKLERWQDAIKAVDIHKIFSHPYVAPDQAKKFDSKVIEQGLRERIAALTIQRQYRKHLHRKRCIESRPVSGHSEWTATYAKQRLASATERKMKLSNQQAETSEHAARMESKLEVIGPHVEVYQSFHQPRSGPTERQRHIAAVILQKNFRGYLVRRYLKRLVAKARLHGFASLKDFLSYYYALIRRIVRLATNSQRRADVQFNMDQIDAFMEDKRRLEIGFDSTAFEGALGERDLMKLFNICGYFPAHREISDTLEAFHSRRMTGGGIGGRVGGGGRGSGGGRGGPTLSKAEAVEIFFRIFKPAGTGLQGDRQSTWMHPIIDGEDAAKYVAAEELEPAPLTQCIRLVASSRLDQLSFEKQVDLRRHLRQLDKMEQLRAEREKAAAAAAVAKARMRRLRGASAPAQQNQQGFKGPSAAPAVATDAAPVLAAKIKIQWMQDD